MLDPQYDSLVENANNNHSPQEQVKQVKNFIFSQKDIIGKGFSSVVYKGFKDGNPKEQVAVKVVELAKIKNEIYEFLLNNEMKALRKLSHPNLVKCIDILMTKNNVYIFLEFCSQGDLLQYVKRKGRLTETEVFKLAIDILKGYIYIQENKIIHRDLKTSNIFMSEGTAKIGDFGFCYFIGEPQLPISYNVGSPAYMPPQSYHQNIYSNKTDVWGIGVIIYQMLTGITPFKTSQYSQMTKNLINGNYGFPSNFVVSESIKKILSFCFREKVSERIEARILLEFISAEVSKIRGNPNLMPFKQRSLTKTPQTEVKRSKSRNPTTSPHRQLQSATTIPLNKPPLQNNSHVTQSMRNCIDYLIFLYRILKSIETCLSLFVKSDTLFTLVAIIKKNQNFIVNQSDSIMIKNPHTELLRQYSFVNQQIVGLPIIQDKFEVKQKTIAMFLSNYNLRNTKAVISFLMFIRVVVEELETVVQDEKDAKSISNAWKLYDYLLLYYEFLQIHMAKLSISEIVKESNISEILRQKQKNATQNHIRLLKLKKKLIFQS